MSTPTAPARRTSVKRSPKQAAGHHAEVLAYRYLKAHGLSFIRANYSCKSGEIDLIMAHGDTVVFVEVKARTNSTHGSAIETITPSKQRRLTRAAQHFIQRHDPRLQHAYRFDVVAIQGSPNDNPEIQWIVSAF
ncbi:conserved hypothetical protein [gamma proteobacterium HdN1]|nr:conserved hypothetical protein [gamma proteobacterium HdN1]